MHHVHGSAVAAIEIAFPELDVGVKVTVHVTDPAANDPINMTVIVAIGVPVGFADDVPGRIARAECPLATEGPVGIGGVEIGGRIVNPIRVSRFVIHTIIPSVKTLNASCTPVGGAIRQRF